MDDDPEGLEDQEPDSEQVTGFDALPEQTRNEIRKLRKEHKQLRERATKAEDLALQGKFSPDVLELVPTELASFEKKWEFAERLAVKLDARPQVPEQGEKPAETPTEEPAPQDKLAALQQGPPPGSGIPQTYTAEEVRKIGLKDPAEALRLVKLGAMKTPE